MKKREKDPEARNLGRGKPSPLVEIELPADVPGVGSAGSVVKVDAARARIIQAGAKRQAREPAPQKKAARAARGEK